MALIGSIAIHVACGVALIAVRSPAARPDEHTAAIALVEPSPTALDLVELVELVELGGGGSPGVATPSTAPRTLVARIQPRRTADGIIRANRADRSLADSLADLSTSSQEISDEESGRTNGDGGSGGGRGGGRGIGRGVGLGDSAQVGDRLPTPPAAPKASKARRAKLIYPTREREVPDGELFVARVTIDTDGYVVGARMLQGSGIKSHDASAMIFRFRYLPALDDDGRPIQSTLEQPFLVQ